jgi:hypothetical protein
MRYKLRKLFFLTSTSHMAGIVEKMILGIKLPFPR